MTDQSQTAPYGSGKLWKFFRICGCITTFGGLILITLLTGSQYAELFKAERLAKASLSVAVETAAK